jgi:hypothetical protein
MATDPITALADFLTSLFSSGQNDGTQTQDQYGTTQSSFDAAPSAPAAPTPRPQRQASAVVTPTPAPKPMAKPAMATPAMPPVPSPSPYTHAGPGSFLGPAEQMFMPDPTRNPAFATTPVEQQMSANHSLGQLFRMLLDAPERDQAVAQATAQAAPPGPRTEGKGRSKQPVESVKATRVK